jgi:CRISPR-associated protein Cas1
MKKSYYLFNPGRLSRKDNTLKFTPVDEDGNELQPRYLPIEGVQNLYVFGSLDANSAMYNFLGKNQVTVHFFDYYEHYTGSFYPKEYLQAGKVQVQQVLHYAKDDKRLFIARSFVKGAAHNIIRNLKYYSGRGRDLDQIVEKIEMFSDDIQFTYAIDELMGLEGNIRQSYYSSFNEIINDFTMDSRNRQPPMDEVNTLISFGNMMCYTLCLDQIYHTQLNPTISYLHEPGFRRYSLALDISEIFKPLLVDRTIFQVLNKKMIQKNDFKKELNRCELKDRGRKTFVKAFEDRLAETIQHRKLKKKVSYKHLVKLECYKISKHILDIEPYEPFRAWW